MTITGLGSTLALGEETTWGTAVTPTLRLPFISEGFIAQPQRILSESLTADRYHTTSARRQGGTSVSGSFTGQVFDRGMGMLFKHMLGAVTTTADTPSAGLNTHVYTPAAFPEGLSAVIGFGGDTSVPAKTVAGCRVNGWELSCKVGAEAQLKLDVVAKTLTTATGVTVAGTQPADMVPLTFLDVSTLTLGGGSPGCVQDIVLSSAHNMIGQERYCLGDATPKKGEETRRVVTGAMTVDFADWALHDLVAAATVGALVLEFSYGTHTLKIETQVQLDGATPVVGDSGIITVTYPFMALATAGDDSTAMKVTAVNGDTA